MNTRIASQRGALSAPAIVVIALVAAAIAAGAGYWYGTRQAPAGGAAPGEPVATDASGRKILYWHDPMVPGQKFDKPGKSPFMDMDLVPVYADEGADEGKVTINPRLVQNLGVRTTEVREATLDTAFTAVGAVGIDERNIVAVQARSPGYVEKLRVRAQYDTVAAGTPLIELYVPEWLAAEEELLALKRSAQPGAAALADAARQRLRLLGVPEAEIARVEQQERPSPRVTISAPVSGVVWEIGARDGMAVSPGMTLFKLAAIGTVWVIADVPEAQAALVRVGAPVEARAAAYPERVFKGSVNALLPEVNAATRTVRARIVLANPGGELKPGMFTTVAFGGSAGKPSLVVPTEAVIRTGKRNVVIVDAGAGKFEPRVVQVGRESGELAAIAGGLKSGERVVVSGQFLVDSEANLKGALARLAAADEKAAGSDPHAGPAQAGAPAAKTHTAEGVVRGVGDEVTIRHGDIPSAGMGPMTMAYKAPPGGVPKDVKEGTHVRFEFVVTPQGEFALTSIAPLATGAKQ